MVHSLLGIATNSIGEACVYVPKTGPSVTVQGVFSNQFTEIEAETNAVITSYIPNLGIRLSDLSTPPARGDKFQIRGINYFITDCHPDGEGGAVLILSEA